MDRISFPQSNSFYQTLKARVDDYFRESRKQKTGNASMYIKTAIILAWLVTAYVLLVFFSASFLMAIITAFALAQGFVLVGFNIMHDANHGSYSRNKTVNRIMGWSLDLIGGSSMLWKQKHNVLHHTYTNVHDLDDDLLTGGLLRLSPRQEWKPWHRFQLWYAFPLYSLLTISWLAFYDFQKLITGRVGAHRMPNIGALQRLFFFSTKLFYVAYALALPLFFHPVLHVLLVFLAIHLVTGLSLAIVFQMAHTNSSRSFPQAKPESGMLPDDWATHQVITTADFAPNRPLAAWYLGGLNYQIEHHLFSRICHVHYPALSRIVRSTCREFSIDYQSFPSIGAAFLAHVRFLRQMGRPPEALPGR
ncbi:MAG: acyl-CoA desaturase [Leptospiraceae bacterium]|nr:acyl-CoA desaturase [Leptospiraceae bacterium]MCB1171682.1 acyl-CoA desaturase [Leptospiraceae bacterium]